MKLTNYHIIKRPLLTEKLDQAREDNNAYAFQVDRRANKIDVKRAVESLFSVEVVQVRTQVVRGKPKRVGYHIGRRPSWKKAIVTLKEGQSIDFVEGGIEAASEE